MKVKIIIISIILLIGANLLNAQVLDSVPDIDSLIYSGQICFDPVPEGSINDNDEIYKIEPQAKFPGGKKALIEYVLNNINYPKSLKKRKNKGTVFLRFEVKETGGIGEIELLRAIHPVLDKEAIKVIKSLPKFIPATQNGKPISTWFSIPITFK